MGFTLSDLMSFVSEDRKLFLKFYSTRGRTEQEKPVDTDHRPYGPRRWDRTPTTGSVTDTKVTNFIDETVGLPGASPKKKPLYT